MCLTNQTLSNICSDQLIPAFVQTLFCLYKIGNNNFLQRHSWAERDGGKDSGGELLMPSAATAYGPQAEKKTFILRFLGQIWWRQKRPKASVTHI